MKQPVSAFSFVIPGTPVAKARPRVTTVNGFARAYTPTKTTNYESLVAISAQSAGCPMFDGAVCVEVLAYWPCPESRKTKRVPRPEEWKTTKPDVDNIAKGICDGLNGVAWADDKQVAWLTVKKLTAAQGDKPRCDVSIKTLEL